MATAASPHPLAPAPFRVVSNLRETADVVTLALEPVGADAAKPAFWPGQFNMLTAFGIGEVPISISSAPADGWPIEHTVREVGAVTRALCAADTGTLVGVRGPFGNGWGVEDLSGADVVVVAGGIGLAPLRGAIRQLMWVPHDGAVVVVVGAREPAQVVFGDELDHWRAAGATVKLTVDVADATWQGAVGVVTSLLPTAPFRPDRTVALVCGPEIMMRFTARSLLERGVDPMRVRLSLERNMQCGIGWCGHCQYGPLLLCRDGPVAPYGGLLEGLFRERER